MKDETIDILFNLLETCVKSAKKIERLEDNALTTLEKIDELKNYLFETLERECN